MKAAAVLTALLAFVASEAGAASPPTLERKAALGVALAPAEGGARIASIAPELTAAKAGLKEDDIVTALNGAPVVDPAGLVALAGKIRAGESVRLDYIRGGAPGTGAAAAVARPFETYDAATATYGAVPFRGGLLRDIYVAPAAARGDGPVVFLIQGAMCATIEGSSPDHPYRALVGGLAARGIATYRIEKPGIGDSAGTPDCADVDFATELDSFRAGLDALVRRHKVDPSRIVIFGHSMGGIQAPLLAAERPATLRGIAVMGFVLRDWRDYLGDVFTTQAFFSSNEDPVATSEGGAKMRRVLDRVFIEKAPLKTIAAESAEDARLLKEELGWDGGDRFMSRNAGFWIGISGQPLFKAWRDAKAPVLAMYGESDFAALDDRDHRLVVDIVNHYRPGTAKYVLLEKTGHPFSLDGSRAEAAAKNQAAGGATGAPLGPFNQDLTRILADWVVALPSPKLAGKQ